MDENNYVPPSKSPEERRQPIALVARLMQDAPNMRHVDEVFLWLSQTIAKHLDITVVQFWTTQLDSNGQFHAALRALASQHQALPQPVHLNQHMALVMRQRLLEKRSSASLPVENVFPASQASLLAHYRLRFLANFVLSRDALLPPPKSLPEGVPSPFILCVAFLTSQPLTREQERAIRFLMEQSIRILSQFQLLHTPGSIRQKQASGDAKKPAPFALDETIPRRTQNLEQFQADNPFSSAAIISDKNARRLYTAIDGRRDVAELLQYLPLERKEVYSALRNLLEEKKIQFYTPQGEGIDASLILSSLS
ncbi:hypothetical protein [Ktedonospora formicarum]|uniref:Uncharacterized protein n=1 Tax=Ktedonospora formicarum TaxID=2778364 RepID=A0A8J3MT03_9CHLR|nr:hypothetical protein [Ktedonospora formicarum]GHO46660.1 hypothetical protein KSX_48230 [Ktedonospora formicarum]